MVIMLLFTPPPRICDSSGRAAMNARVARLTCLPLWLVLILLLVPPVQAQQNPPVTSCGLPASGPVYQSVTYSLSRNCVLTGTITVIDGVSMTINGNGHKITSRDANTTWIMAFQISTPGPTVTLSRVTLDGQENRNSQVLNITNLTANQVTFQGNRRGIWDVLATANSAWNLTDVVFRDNEGSGFTNGGVLEARNGATLAMRNTVLEGNSRGIAVIKNENSTATITVSGCLTNAGNLPRAIQGSWTNNSTGPCAGTVGNGVRAPSGARPAACGFPQRGYILSSATYTLSANCRMTGNLFIADGATVTVNGNGHTILGNSFGRRFSIADGARLNINNLALRGVRFYNYGHLESQLLTVKGQSGRPLYNFGAANFSKLLLDNLDHSAHSLGNTIFAYNAYGRGEVTITDGIFRNIKSFSSAATIWTWGAMVNLNGCISFIDTSPVDIRKDAGGDINYSSSGACAGVMLDEFAVPAPFPREAPRSSSSSPAEAAVSPKSAISTCLSLPASIQVSGLSKSTQCQRVSGPAISDPAIRQAAIDAVDVWSWVLPNTQVCFAAAGGTIKFIDTASIPRVVYNLPAYRYNGMTCATIDRAGIVALLPGPPAPALQAPAQSLSDCKVRTKYILNLRDAPGGKILDMMPYNITLTALERQAGWYKVDFLGQFGWVSADYVAPEGACDY